MADLSRPLRRSVHNRVLAGVCGGLAEYFELDATLIRVIYVLASVLSAGFPGTLVYVILWFVIPPRDYV